MRNNNMVKPLTRFSIMFPVVTAMALAQPVQPLPAALFAQLGLTDKQRADIDAGKPVAKVLSWGGPSEVHVFGAVYIDGSPAAYVKMARDTTKLAASPGYLGIGELPATATSADLSAFTLDPDDIKALKACREGDCDVQLPTSSIQAFHDAVNWSQADAASQASGLARGMVLDLIRAYRRGGNEALGVYRDKDHPARVAEQFKAMVGRSSTLPDVAPELRRYLLDYPNADLSGADNFFYWEKVNFGLKPTIRVNHGVVYRAPSRSGDVSVIAIKQLYASHYFHTALDVSVCLPDASTPLRHGFYLVTLKSSEQDGLTGMKGSVLRKVVVDKTRSSLEGALASIKQNVEKASATPAR
jgi:hypothetical protein